ncbi:hypothetical protein ACWDPV_09210 [Gordonia sp. NPDC003504]
MSYDHCILPAEYCADGGTAQQHMSEQFGKQPQPEAEAIAERISARDPELDEDGFLSASPLDAEGDCVYVPSPFPRIQQARDVVIEESLRDGYGVYDPQYGFVLGPREMVDGAMISSTHGTFPAVWWSTAEKFVNDLKVDSFLVVETGPEIYVQTKRLDEDMFDVEYRDGSADRHFATQVTSADDVVQIMRDWRDGDREALQRRAWDKLELG